MPRFENEGFNPDSVSKNNEVDRTVPADEDYYNYSQIDLNFNSKTRGDENNIVVDNQRRASNYENVQKNDRGDVFFRSETADDFDRTRRSSSSGSNSGAKSRFGKKSAGQAPKKKRKKGSMLRTILIIILVIILALVGSVYPILARVNYDEKKDDEYVSSSELESSSSVKNILLLGVDARSDDEDSASRSDTMMLVSVDSKHHCIKLVSFLRDTWVYIPSLGYEQRLNAACSSGGYKNVVETIEYNFGIDIDSYVVTDFEMFEVLVDSIGGVDVEVSEAEAEEVTNHPKRYGNVTLESGEQILTGEQALAYCRIRKIDTDFVRTERQRTVMTAIIKKAVSNPFKLYKMAYSSAPYVETDMSKGELMALAAKAVTCAFSIHQTSVPFDGTWSYATISGNSVISIDTEENKEKLIDYIYNLSSDEIEAQEAETDE